jgi:glycosyltransferase involved in cell wall biosynthesis
MWAYVLTHPIQYYTPALRRMARSAGDDFEVLYCSGELESSHARAGFGVEYRWDVPLLDGYRYRFLKNCAKVPSTSSFAGLDNPELGRLIANRTYTAVVVNGWHFKSAWRTILACWRHGVPLLVRSDSHLRGPRTFRQWAKWPLYRSLIPRIDGCLPAGAWSREYFENYGAREDHIFTIPHCVDNRRFEREMQLLRPQREAVRRQWGIPPGATVFLFAGKFIPVKRPADFVSAIARSARLDSSVVGLMAGDGPLRAQCEEHARAAAAPVRFTGFLNQSRIPEAYAAADALVLPSETETWGLVVNEAMACGLPCIVSDRVGCGPDIVDRGVTGDVYPMGDIEALAALLLRNENLAALGRNAQRKIESYSVAAAASATLKAVDTVSSRRRSCPKGRDVAQTPACWIETHLDPPRREESPSERSPLRQECLRQASARPPVPLPSRDREGAVTAAFDLPRRRHP